MPSAAKVEWPQGTPLFEVMWRSVTESLAGNGVTESTGMEVTATVNNREVSVAPGTIFYVGSNYTLGASTTATVSVGDANDPRWDIVYFDTATSSVGTREGTPSATPEPPDLQGGEMLLAVLKVTANFDAPFTRGTDLFNWRAQFSNEAEETHYDDSTGIYGVGNVSAALDELQEAAQISAYPLAIATDTEASAYPLANSDLANSTITANAGTGLSTTNAAIGLGGSATLSITAGGVTLTELASPFGLPDITDMDAAGNDLEDAGTTIWDTSAGFVPRAQVDQDYITHTETASGTNTGYTTAGEEVIFVDTATNGASFTVTIASADVVDGRGVRVVDVGGGAATNSITIDTEGTETIDGETSIAIEDNYGAAHLISEGTNLSVAGGTAAGTSVKNLVEGAESGAVANGDQGILIVDELADGQTLRIQKAILTTSTVQAAPTGVDLELVTFDNAGGFTSRATLVTGDGATVHDRVTGSPVASYENVSGAAQSVGVIVDNGSGASVNIISKVAGDII